MTDGRYVGLDRVPPLDAEGLAEGWNWGLFQGSSIELKWNRKDLESLKMVVPLARHRNVAVQAGGCLGIFPKYLAAKFRAVYTFEPSPEMFPKLVANAPESNIIRFQAALGARLGLVDPVCSLRGNDGKTVLHEGMTRVESGRGRIPTMRVDDLALPYCDLLYLDIEGWEMFALQGAQATITRCRPVIALEINRGIEYQGHTRDDVMAALQSLSYRWYGKHRSDEFFLPSEHPEAR